MTVNVTPVDDVPVNTTPGPQSTPEDTDLTISGLSVGDLEQPQPDHDSKPAPGQWHFNGDGRGSGATITGDGTGTVTIACTQAQINAALAAIIYTPTADFNTGAGSIDLTGHHHRDGDPDGYGHGGPDGDAGGRHCGRQRHDQ